MKSAWNQHGHFRLIWRGDVLVLSLEGTWSDVAAQRLREAGGRLAREHADRPWGLLSDTTAWEGATPEALDGIWAFFEDALAHGLVAAATVIPDSFQALIIQPMAARTAAMTNFHGCASVADAEDWLRARGLSLGPA
jgi:hypothetical protein